MYANAVNSEKDSEKVTDPNSVLYVEPTDNDAQGDDQWSTHNGFCPLEKVGSLSWQEEQERLAKKRHKNSNWFTNN